MVYHTAPTTPYGRGDLSRISAAAEDELVRCPECGAILLRVKGFEQ